MLRQSGAIETDSYAAMLDILQVLACQPVPAGPRLTVIGNAPALNRLAVENARSVGLEIVEVQDIAMLDAEHSVEDAIESVTQAITGALFAALGVMAEGAGTMNNVSFGNATHQYYETLASGSGAGDGFHGTDVVQTHMTNSRLTDPEVLESRYPVLLESHAIRSGSGGGGRWLGGDGGVRRLRFLEPMTVSLLSGHRRIPPYGMAGGSPGALGRNCIERADGTLTHLAGNDVVEVVAGDVLVVETPGGGGYGDAGAPSG